MRRETVFLIVLAGFLGAGCSFINFSGHYYDLPASFNEEVETVWRKVTAGLPIKRPYRYVISTEEETKGLKGIPAISNGTVFLPHNFLKYVYQNYYNDRAKILTCVITHELSHDMFNLPSEPDEEHFKTDVQAIVLLGNTEETASTYYYSLIVLKNYWFARKGMGGHTVNATWNIMNAASVAFGGPGFFVDWFATDLKMRLKLLKRNFTISSRYKLRKSREPY